MDALIVSNALDTNGQNARYAAASKKHGAHDKVLSSLLIGEVDLAGVGNRFAIAAEKFGTLNVRAVHRAAYPFYAFPSDLIWNRHNERQIRQLALNADIIHLNNSAVAYRRLRLPVRGKPVLLHHHGSLFRGNPKHLLGEARNLGALQAVSTVDLLHVAPEQLHWLPTAYDIDELAAFGAAHRREPDGRIRVVSAPTNRVYKSTAMLETAVAKLQAEGLAVDLVLVENRPWLECMAIKATADIYFDQVLLGYGCNAVEAWGMGIPVIAGADAWTLAKMREVYGTDKLPFYEATEDTIGEAIVDLAQSKAKRTAYAKRGMAHVRKFHDELPALTRLAELYRMAIQHQFVQPVVLPTPPATFRAEVPQVRAAGRFVTFHNGTYTTDNPYIATALRNMALRYPKYHIEEVVA